MSEKVYFTEEQRIDQLGIKLFMAALASFALIPFTWADWGPPVPIETPMTLMGIIFALTVLGTQRPYEFKKALQRARGEESVE